MYNIPERVTGLYRHWSHHTRITRTEVPRTDLNQRTLEQMSTFAAERMHVWHKHYTGSSVPYTQDPILQSYRFCNIYRELDRQTIEIHELLAPLRDDFLLWLLNVAFCRFVCSPATVQHVGLLSFDNAENEDVMQRLLALPKPKYGSAYVFPISAIQKSETPTRESFFCLHLPRVMSEVATKIESLENASVVDALDRILPAFGFNLRFHWTEILIDVAYQYPERIDLFAPFPIGPGALPTMQMLNATADPTDVCLALTQLEQPEFPHLSLGDKLILLSAENWEGIGCEFRKYTNLKNGKGRKRYYANGV